METITKSLLIAVLMILTAMFCLFAAMCSASTQQWWVFSFNIALMLIDLRFAWKWYKHAKSIENDIYKSLDHISHILFLDALKEWDKTCQALNKKIADDELEKH